MSAIFNYCDSVAKSSPQANLVIDQIIARTTPEQFEELRTRFPKFQLNHADLENRTILHKAAGAGNVLLIEYIVKQAPQLLERGDKNGYTPLHYAAIRSHIAATNSLIELGANVNVMQFSNYAGDADVALLNQILAYNLNLLSSKNENFINHLIFIRSNEIVKLLVKNGAQLSSRISNTTEELLFKRAPQFRPRGLKAAFESIIERFRQKLAEERRQTSEIVYNLSLLPRELCNLLAEYS